jgi:hypothetical protein
VDAGDASEVAALSACVVSTLSPSQAITVIEQKTIAESASIEDRNESKTLIDSLELRLNAMFDT